MWADFQVYIKDASFREEHFCHWNLRSISSHSWVVLILVRKPLEYFLIMIHGPSSLFIGRLVDVSRFSSLYKRRLFGRNIFVIESFALSPLIPELYWFSWESLWSIFWLWSMVLLAFLLDDSLMWADFQVYIKDASFREEHFCHWNLRSISSHSWVVLILVRKPLEYFLIMIHGPSSLFIGRLVDVSRFSVSNKSWALREEHFCHWNFRSISPHPWVILILVRKPLEFFWFWSKVLLAYLLDDSLMWADFEVYIKDASFRKEHFCHWKFRSISSHSWVVLILVRKPLEYFLIMIHGPSSFFIGRLVDVSWFSSLYKRCVFSRGTFLSLKVSLYLLSFLSCIDSREKAFEVFFDYDPWSF